SKTQFPDVQILHYAFFGPFIGALARSTGGAISDRLGGTRVTLVNFVVKYIKRLVPKYHLPDAISFRSALQHGYRMQYIKPEIVSQDLA
ncbi:hypothetical protein ACS0TW_14520, partial [Klebsiella michiganensis]